MARWQLSGDYFEKTRSRPTTSQTTDAFSPRLPGRQPKPADRARLTHTDQGDREESGDQAMGEASRPKLLTRCSCRVNDARSGGRSSPSHGIVAQADGLRVGGHQQVAAPVEIVQP